MFKYHSDLVLVQVFSLVTFLFGQRWGNLLFQCKIDQNIWAIFLAMSEQQYSVNLIALVSGKLVKMFERQYSVNLIALVPGKGSQPSPSPLESSLYWVAIQQLPWDPQDEVISIYFHICLDI